MLNRRLRYWFDRSRRSDGLNEEMRLHVEEKISQLRDEGVGQAEAERRALQMFGNRTQYQEESREVWISHWSDVLVQDLRYGVRTLRRSPWFTVTAAISLAIGIGANTAIFTVANALLFRAPAGIVSPDRLVDIGSRRGDGGLNPLSSAVAEEIGRRAGSLSGLFRTQMFPQAMSLVRPGATEPLTVHGQFVSLEFFRVLGSTPSIGRVFNSEDSSAIVLRYEFWAQRLRSDPTVVGNPVRINGQSYSVIGVASEGFQGTGVVNPDFWLPLDPGSGASVLAVARLKPGVSVGQASAEVATLGVSIDAERGVGRSAGGPTALRLAALPMSRAGGNRNVVSNAATALMILVSLLLTTACANVTSVMLARATSRAKEMALRSSLGAGSMRLVRQLLTESALLFSLGGALGLALAKGLILLLPLLPSLPFPTNISVAFDVRVFVFTALLSLFASLIFGLAPALRGSKVNPADTLKEDSESSLRGSRLRGLFVVGQVALSLLLVVVAAFLLGAMRFAGSTDPGFDPHGIEVAALDLGMSSYSDATRPLFWQNAVRRVRELPGIESATVATVPPGGFEGFIVGNVAIPGAAPEPEPYTPAWNIVDSGYFSTMRIPLVRGREFLDTDGTGAQQVAIVGEGVARHFWPGKPAVGELLELAEWGPAGIASRRNLLVVGVAKDIKSTSLIDGLSSPYVYLPVRQTTIPLFTTRMSILARTRQGGRVTNEIASVIHDLDPFLAVVSTSTVEESVALGLAPHRILTALSASLGATGLLLAAIGIYGVIAMAVVRRRREIGIRLALGEHPRQVVARVLRQGLVLTVAGCTIGAILSAGAELGLSAFVYGLPQLQVPIILGATIIFVAVGMAASYLPARRAASVDPLISLREK